jgi:hypothetical protein
MTTFALALGMFLFGAFVGFLFGVLYAILVEEHR